MIFRLFLLFSVVPIIEVWLLIRVGRVIGPLPTAAVLLAISFTGAWVARHQGTRVFARIRDDLAQGQVPAAGLLDGALVLCGGILLMTPGFFTDAVGLFFLFPATRAILKLWARRAIERSLSRGVIIIHRR